jgi:hypothetical protein
MEGFKAAPVQESNPPKCGGKVAPTFKGKAKGDANCDGFIRVDDYSLWHKEFVDGDLGSVSKKTWNADFTGPNAKCDGKVDIYDFSLWHKFFSEINNISKSASSTGGDEDSGGGDTNTADESDSVSSDADGSNQ